MAPRQEAVIGVIGAGTMGAGIAQLAATFGHRVRVYDSNHDAIGNLQQHIDSILSKRVQNGRISDLEKRAVLAAIQPAERLSELADAALVIEAVVERLDVKQQLFADLEQEVSADCILGTNTSSLPIAAIASACRQSERVVGIHFFNPAPVLPLVEIVPSLLTDQDTVERAKSLVSAWDKVPVVAKDTPGFIVNRIARPYYGEALRLLEEGRADIRTIDCALKDRGGFKMGPFEVMDLIGHDVNFTVTKTVFESTYFDPRYRPSIAQQRLVEAGLLGRKSGRGFYDYRKGAEVPEPLQDDALWNEIFLRVLSMIVNEAADAILYGVASAEDIDLAMTKGVNYPKGPLAWGEEIGLSVILEQLTRLQNEYAEDRYRPSPLLRRMVERQSSFFSSECTH